MSAETEKPVETVFFHLVPNMLKGSIHTVQEDPEDTSKVIGSTEEDTASDRKNSSTSQVIEWSEEDADIPNTETPRNANSLTLSIQAE